MANEANTAYVLKPAFCPTLPSTQELEHEQDDMMMQDEFDSDSPDSARNFVVTARPSSHTAVVASRKSQIPAVSSKCASASDSATPENSTAFASHTHPNSAGATSKHTNNKPSLEQILFQFHNNVTCDPIVLNLSHLNLTIVPQLICDAASSSSISSPTCFPASRATSSCSPTPPHLRLTSLYLNNNCLILPPAELYSLASLTHLSLDHNQLTLLPPGIHKLANSLRSLNIGHNPLTSLPHDFGKLNQLAKLKADRIGLFSFPRPVCQLADSLTHLDLSQNGFRRVDPQIVQLTRLRWLRLAHNALSELPDEVGTRLTQLRHIDLNWNEFVRVPDCLCQLASESPPAASCLKVILLRGNQIRVFTDDQLLATARVTKLDLRENSIETRPDHWKPMTHIITGNAAGNSAGVSEPLLTEIVMSASSKRPELDSGEHVDHHLTGSNSASATEIEAPDDDSPLISARPNTGKSIYRIFHRTPTTENVSSFN